MTLTKKLKKYKKAYGGKSKRGGPLWKGPEIDGITQSMLSRFLVCRERFRLLVVEGLRPVDTFNHRIEYGQMWHVCEEALAKLGGIDEIPLKAYSKDLCEKYPLQQEQIQHWYNVCKVQFPIYVDYWAKDKSAKNRTSLLSEQVFNVPYGLPSGRIVRLRGKWDGIVLEGKGRNAGIWLEEHKTKGDVNEEQIKRQLQFDLQTMLYLVALVEYSHQVDNKFKAGQQIQGVLYNVVRRPLSGGKYSISPLKGKEYKRKANVPPETSQQFCARLGKIITADPEWFFMRWKAIITPQDIERFKREFLDPILEQLCDWWAYQNGIKPPLGSIHWRTPYGFYNVLAEGGSTELDEYLATGSELGLERTDKLFRELE